MAENGSITALRDALEELMKFTCNWCNERYCEEYVEEEDGIRNCSPCSAIIQARNALSASPETPSNAAAMREALEEQLRYWDAHIRTRDEEEMRKRTEAALSLPPRNCDVGTADEQADRFKAFCYANRTPDNECSKECQFNDTSAVCYCQARWAQEPYERKEETDEQHQ